MDVDVARWIFEFLLRQPVDDRTLNALLRVLPLSNANSSLKKAMLLRRIESEIAKRSVSEKILTLLEHIEQLEYEEGVGASEAMKGAYCAAAVDCTVRFLDESEGKGKGRKYSDAVKRIWRDRVWKMEKSEKVGLVSEELLSWKDEVEAAVVDASVGANAQLRNRVNDALEDVQAYVAEAWESLGPPFLEMVTEKASNHTMTEELGRGNEQMRDPVGEKAPSLPDSRQDLTANSVIREMQKGILLPRRKHVAGRRSRRVISGTSRRVKIFDEDLDARASSNNYGFLPTPEIDKVRQALRTSSLELQEVVKDPLPDALQFAGKVMSCIEREVGQNKVGVDSSSPSVGRSAEQAKANDPNIGNQCAGVQNITPKPSLMAQNSTALTHEWEDSAEMLAEVSPESSGRLHLPTSKTRVVSPLKKYEITKFARRRRKNRWSILEEDTLRTGVQKYGKGNWKLILNSYRDIFEERTEGDLKDKWRNMTR